MPPAMDTHPRSPLSPAAALADLTAYAASPAPGSDRSFGLVFAAVFAGVGMWPLGSGGALRVWALLLSGAFLIVALLQPLWLAPLNRLWMHLGMMLSRIVSPVALLVVYCLAVLPTAALLRLSRKDLLGLKSRPAAPSYWIERTPPARADGQMKKQF